MKELINKELSYQTSYWKTVRFGKKRKITYTKYLIEKSGDELFMFHSGFIPRVLKFLKKHSIDFDYKNETPIVEFDDPEIEGIDFRYYQKEQIETALEIGRGVIKSATGTGKSYDIMGIINAFSQENILFLADSSDILKQLKEDVLKVVQRNEMSYYKDQKSVKRIHVSTVQTFKNICSEYKNYFDVIIIDEVDKVSSFDGMYAKVLNACSAPVKLGVTATIPNDKIECRWALEALIGPMISEYTIKQAGEDEVLSKPILHFIKSHKIPASELMDSTRLKERHKEIYEDKLKTWNKKGKKGKKPYKTLPKKYNIVYDNAIVHNVERNNDIASAAENIIYQGGCVLISVVKTQHGLNLKKLIKLGNCEFIYGDTLDEERDRIKEGFINGKIHCVIASDVWKRGISVHRINCYIKAEGGKSETSVIQWAGRPLRQDKGNKTIKFEKKIIRSGQVLMVDFDDSNLHPYLKKHTLIRQNIYREQGWIK
jgi:superfamily II DNA or RNA helicase